MPRKRPGKEDKEDEEDKADVEDEEKEEKEEGEEAEKRGQDQGREGGEGRRTSEDSRGGDEEAGRADRSTRVRVRLDPTPPSRFPPCSEPAIWVREEGVSRRLVRGEEGETRVEASEQWKSNKGRVEDPERVPWAGPGLVGEGMETQEEVGEEVGRLREGGG